jgi:phage FluMu gp28-like protein
MRAATVSFWPRWRCSVTAASRIQQVMLSEGWYREHMPPVKAALEDGTLVDLPRDADMLADLRAVQVVKGVPRVPDTPHYRRGQGQAPRRCGRGRGAGLLTRAASSTAARFRCQAAAGRTRIRGVDVNGY